MSRLAAVVLLAVLLGACSDDPSTVSAGDGTPTTSTPASTPAADPLVLQVRTGGGFVPPGSQFAELPSFSLYAGGRVVVTGPTTLEYPGAALPNLLTGAIGAGGVQAAVKAARDAGIGQRPPPDLGQPAVADAPTTTIVVVDGGHTYRLDVYALGLDDGLPAGPAANRRRLSELLGRLEKEGSVAREPYRASAVSVLVTPYPAGQAPEPAPGEADWPLGDLSAGGVEQYGGRCLGFSGDDAQRVLDAAGKARSNTRWRSGGQVWALTFRPELPGDQPCATR